MKLRISIALLVIGAIVSYGGYKEFKLAQLCDEEPCNIELAELENGQELDNMNVKIGKHWAVYPHCIYEYQQSEYETGEPGNNSTVNYTYYPIISNDHPYNLAMDEFEAKYSDPNVEVPDDAYPEFENFKVLVKSRKFKTIGSIPDGWDEIESVSGIVINEIDGLDKEEQDLLKQSITGLDLDDVYILEMNRKPQAKGSSFGKLIGGLVMMVIGGGIFFIGNKG